MEILMRQEDLKEEALGLGRVEGCRGGYVKWHMCKRDFNSEASGKY